MPIDPDGLTLSAAGKGSLPGPEETEAVVRLTRREREVLRLLVARYTDRQIAAALSISYRTVTTHVASIRTKLGVHSRRDIAGRVDSLEDDG